MADGSWVQLDVQEMQNSKESWFVIMLLPCPSDLRNMPLCARCKAFFGSPIYQSNQLQSVAMTPVNSNPAIYGAYLLLSFHQYASMKHALLSKNVLSHVRACLDVTCRTGSAISFAVASPKGWAAYTLLRQPHQLVGALPASPSS